MRVLFVMTDALVGGAERLVAMLGRHWPAGDTLKLVVLLSRGTLSEQLEASFAEVTYLDIDFHSRRLDQMVRKLEREIDAFAPDVIASHMFHADLVTALARTKVPKVTTAHTHGLGPQDLLLTKAIARAVGVLSFRFKATIPTSDSADMAAFLKSLGMRRVVEAIPNATELPDAPTFDPRARTVVSIARNHPVKGHGVLLDAFALAAADHADWSLRLVGPGVTADAAPFVGLLGRPELAALHRAGRIELTGPTLDPGAVIDTAGALVISSLYGETTPLVGLEAGARGVPVVTTRVGSCPTFADDPQFVATPGDASDLARALAAYCALSDAQRTHLSALARARAERDYDPEVAAARYRAVFASVLGWSW